MAAARLATSVNEKQEISNGPQKVFARRVGITAGELVLVGKSDSVDDEIECLQALFSSGKYRIHRGQILDIARSTRSAPTEAASGFTRLPSASP